MTKTKAVILLIIILCIVGGYSCISLIDGWRFTAIAAANAQSSVGMDAVVFDQLDLPWGKVFLLDTPNGERTAVVRKKGPLWFCNLVTTFNPANASDPVRTVGWLNYQYSGGTSPESIALIDVITSDPQVAWIEVGEGTDRVKKQIEPNKPLLVWWPKAFIGSSLKPIALSSEDKPLYEYRFAQENVTDTTTLKWYPIKNN
ncbi:hypothetical protein SAMN04487895_1229 [Paenibacillus sophorae]|uniref:Uncharacterized protein n=1 Tax=Paenibacillus sophorae TaxID=1333845 RepID=A0A1H8V8B0_9BACL|nr:hypothetical protein [Paenibacillus sophorae]QWU13256.1 hypothetical protein KP014_14640 [Paenibacillus sophorae]SEP11591.1 hypothetical protein SAMN04487895_1229 [Paenibacillus sophorae]